MSAYLKRRAKRLDFLFLAAWLMTGLGAALLSLLQFGMDFRGYYAAARVLLEGGNPYDYRLVAEVLREVTGAAGNNPFYYPLWFAWLFVPIAYLPFQVARATWLAFNLILWDVGLWRLGNFLDGFPAGWRRYALFLLATLLFALPTFMREQAGVLLFAMSVALLYALRNRRWNQAGIWLALLLIKPNITLGAVVGIGLWLMRRGQPRPVLTSIIALLALLIISTALTPGWTQPLAEAGFGRGLTSVTDGPEKITGVRINATLLDWMAELNAPPRLRWILYGVALLVAAVLFLRVALYAPAPLAAFGLLSLISCAVTPYALQYDYPPLVITLFWTLALPLSTRAAERINVLLVGLISLANIIPSSMAFRYWIVVGLAALVINALRNSQPQDESRAAQPELSPQENAPR